MKTLFKFFLLTAAIFSCSASLSAQKPGEGTRIDFLDHKGERFFSQYYEFQNQIFFSIDGNDDDGYIATCSASPFGKHLNSIKFVHFGTESYPLSFVNEQPDDIQVRYELLSDEKSSPKKIVKRENSEKILPGSIIRIWITVPDGAYPVVNQLYEYTRVSANGFENWNTYNSLGLAFIPSAYPTLARTWGDPQTRNQLLEILDYTGVFVKSDEAPNLWYYDTYMNNEPMSVKISYERPDSKLLQASLMGCLSKLYTQYSDFQTTAPHCAGETLVSQMCGEFISQDFISSYFAMNSNADVVRNYLSFEALRHSNYWITNAPWATNFAAISHANLLLFALDRFSAASDSEREQVKAQLLALRSHCYFRLMQLYGPRWAESNNGATLCAPLETEFSAEPSPAASMKAIADRCYADLDEAIEIMERTGFKRSNIIQPDINTARGIKMRIAMLREDWLTARELGMKILNEKPLTSNSELQAGFYNPVDSWIWGAWNNTPITDSFTNSLYYFSFQSWAACNGAYPGVWGMGANAIDRDLFLSIPENDVRRLLFVMPESCPALNLNDCFDSNRINENRMTLKEDIAGKIRDGFTLSENIFYPTFTFENTLVPIQFGAQTKFYQPGANAFDDAAMVLMRSDEVLLSTAEACSRLGDDAKARELVNRLNSMRCEGYNTTASGTELLAEIQKTRKIELWGEGHSWFDQKRWNIPISRRHWQIGDLKSGNWYNSAPTTVATDYANGWRYPIPAYYLLYNPLIDISKMGYDDVEGYEQSTSAPAKAPLEKSAANGLPELNQKLFSYPQSIIP